jgi:hypothetical protein
MAPLPFVNAAFFSMLQIKVPPDLQGRVFAVVTQLAMLLSPVANLLAGLIADHVAEPAVGGPGWQVVAPLVGNQHGAGMGLIALSCGLVLSLLTIVVYAVPAIRHIERDLPDYAPAEPAEEAVSATMSVESEPTPVLE